MQDTTHTKLQAIRDARKRWQTRLTRSTNKLADLARQEARLLKKIETPLPKPVTTKVPDEVKAMVTEAIGYPPVEAPALEIPAELKRADAEPGQSVAATLDVDKLADILNPAAAINKRRLERLDAKRRGYRLPKVDKTAMPLSGREAERFLRKKK